MVIEYNKLILKDLSGEFKAGTSTAIIGPSGSGKTTLLNFICARMKESPSLAVNGNLYVNGHKVDSIKEMKHRFGYVMQFDVMYDDFTPREQFYDTARLAGVADPNESTENVIDWFNLQKCQNTRVGGLFTHGLSGGEKKRTSIGLEVISNPSVVFMDEPTTGLDSKSALDVAKLIKVLAANGRTIITTIHQPSTDILARFDRIICLCEGRTIYDGKPLEIPQYFARLGYAPPAHTNPADHVMTIVNDDDIRIREFNKGNKVTETEVRKEFEERLDQFSKAYNQSRPTLGKERGPDEQFEALKVNPHNQSTFFVFQILIKKFCIYSYRNFNVFVVKIIQSLAFVFFNIILYNDLADFREDTVGALQDKQGLVFCVTGTMCFAGFMSSVNGIIPLLPANKRENEARLYSPVSYYFVSTLYQFPMQLIIVFVYLGAGWYICDFKPGFQSFFEYYSVLYAAYAAASGFGDILSYSIQNIELINQLLPIVVVPYFLLSGFTVKVKDTAFYLFYYSYLSFFRFAYQAGIYIEFGDNEQQEYLAACRIKPEGCDEASCAVPMPGNVACDPFAVNDFPETNFWVNIGILYFQALLFRLIACIIFVILSKDKKIPYEEIPPKESFVEPILGVQNISKFKIFIQLFHFLEKNFNFSEISKFFRRPKSQRSTWNRRELAERQWDQAVQHQEGREGRWRER